MKRNLSPLIPAAVALLLSGCESFDPHNIQNWEPLAWFDGEDPAIAEAAQKQAVREAHEAALLAANPKWREYDLEWRRTHYREAAALAADFKLDALDASDLSQLVYVLEKGGAPKTLRDRVNDTRVDRSYPGWLALRYDRPGGNPKYAHAFEYLAERPYRDATESYILTYARAYLDFAGDQVAIARIDAKLKAAETARLAEVRAGNEADRARVAKAAAEAEVAEARRHAIAAEIRRDADRANQFNIHEALDKNSSRREQRRCASCLGSGKAGYVLNQKTYQTDTSGRSTQVADAPCSSCNGTGYRE